MKRFSAPILLLLMLALAGCGGDTVFFAGEKEPADFSLSFQDPQTFEFSVPEAGKFSFAVELTFFPEQMQGWTEVPVYYIHGTPDGKEADGKFSIPIKDAKGEWGGKALENGHDRIIETKFKTGIELATGSHKLKFYGDNKQQGQPILGIVRFTFKVYK